MPYMPFPWYRIRCRYFPLPENDSATGEERGGGRVWWGEGVRDRTSHSIWRGALEWKQIKIKKMEFRLIVVATPHELLTLYGIRTPIYCCKINPFLLSATIVLPTFNLFSSFSSPHFKFLSDSTNPFCQHWSNYICCSFCCPSIYASLPLPIRL